MEEALAIVRAEGNEEEEVEILAVLTLLSSERRRRGNRSNYFQQASEIPRTFGNSGNSEQLSQQDLPMKRLAVFVFISVACIGAPAAAVSGVIGDAGAKASDFSPTSGIWVLFDDFRGPLIDPGKWYGWEYQAARMLRETSRSIVGGSLRLTARGYTDPLTPADVLEGLNYVFLVNDKKVKGLRANMKIKEVQFSNCDDKDPCNADLRVKGTFFNTGTPAPGSYKDDVNAMIYLRTYSNRRGLVDIHGIVDRCVDDYCAVSEPLFDEILGTVDIRRSIALGIEWDKADQRFILIHGEQTTAWSYKGKLSDQKVGNTMKDLNARLIIPNTDPRKRSMAFIDARVGSVCLKY